MAKQLVQYSFVGAAGFLGAVSRYFIGALVTFDAFPFGSLPWGTLTVNLLGSLVLGFFLTITTVYWKIPDQFRLAVATGFLGSFTTYSTFAVDIIRLFSFGYYFIVVFYILANYIGAFLLAYGGIRWAESIMKGRERAGDEK